MRRSEYLEENAQYIGETAASIIESMSDEQFETLFEAVKAFSLLEPGFGEFVKTHETLADFHHARERHWCERGAVKVRGEATLFEGYQLHKGDARRTIAVVDLGDFRLCLD